MLCSRCEARKPYVPSGWFNHIWALYSLQRGGYPFEADELTIEEWQDLGVMKDEIEAWRTRLR